jgi:hypothetical protein
MGTDEPIPHVSAAWWEASRNPAGPSCDRDGSAEWTGGRRAHPRARSPVRAPGGHTDGQSHLGEAHVLLELENAWPASLRDDHYSRLRSRWDLDYDHQPAWAVAALRRALADLPHDWQTRYRLARALHALGRTDEARREAEAVARLREQLDPIALGQRLEADLARLDDPVSRLDLADLCAHAGLVRLADAWRRDAARPTSAAN